MSSVQSAISQISKSGTHFISVSAGTFYSDVGTNTLLEGFTVGTGSCQAKIGSSVIFSTPATVTTALGAAALSGNCTPLGSGTSPATAAGDIYKDMGKEIKIFTQGSGSGPAELYVVFTRVRLVKGDSSNLTEGDNGRLGYIATYTSAPGTATVAVTVARVGAGHSRA
jgi:hypothetical protein